jgi:hypothetical protein
MIVAIRWVGWMGVAINLVAICTKDTDLFLLGQIVASFSAFLWSKWLQRSITFDLVISLVLTAIAAVVKEPFVMYSAMLVRSCSYQFQFERVVKQRFGDI